MPILGSVAFGYSELAATRDDAGLSDELWALGMRLGGNMAVIFGIFGSIPAARPRPATDLDASDARFDALRTVSVAEAVTRLATLIGHPR